MVQINSSYQLKIYDLDTQKSVFERIASTMQTTPLYLYFPNGIPTIEELHSEADIKVENLLDIIKSEANSFDFVSFFDSIKDKTRQNNLNVRDDVLLPFIVFNKTITDVDEDMRGALLYATQTEIDNAKPPIFDTKVDIQRIWDDKENIIQNIVNSINTVKKTAQEKEKVFESFSKIESTVNLTDFETEQVRFEFELNTKDVSIMEIFNHIQLTPAVPFASINDTYKIMKDFLPPEDWQYTLENSIMFKILQREDVANAKFSDYSDMFLVSVEENDKKLFKVIATLMTSGQYLKRDQLIERFSQTLRTLGPKLVIKSTIVEKKVKGLIYFPKRKIDKYILSDIVMNNPLFSKLFSIDERDKATKDKQSIYIHFKHPKIGDVKASITSKIAVRGDNDLKGKNIKRDFSFGSDYIRVKISSAENTLAVEQFTEMLSKLFVVYSEEESSIIRFYREFIPNFATEKRMEIKEVRKLKLKDIAPEVFVQGYPSSCTKQPTIIEDDEVEMEKAQGKIVMRYPIDATEGVQPRNYVCNHKKAIYPGLRNNSLANKDKLPYLPCCYEKNHETREGSIFRHYYFGEPLADKSGMEQQDLITTNKFVPKDKYGTLPTDITKLFEVFDYDEKYMYVRKGVFDTKSSFMDCVLEGLYDKTDVLKHDALPKRLAFLTLQRKSLATPERANLCRQEMYDFTTSEIQNIIQNTNTYMDPKLFISLLEQIYDCNIYVFNRDGIRSGKLSVPRHTQAYYKNVRKSRCIFIYEHTGSVSDRAEYPRCELIVKWKIGSKKEEDVSYYSSYNSNISKGIRKLFNRITKSYALNTPITRTIFPITNRVKLISQSIDSYGKTRMLNFKYNNKLGTFLTTPLQPFALPEANRMVEKINANVAVQMASELKIRITGQTIVNGILKEIHGSLGTVKLSIPLLDSVPLEGVPQFETGLQYPESDVSILDNYNMYKKLARYITEYCYWLFSRYLHEKSSTDMSLNSIDSFRKDKIVIKPDFVYERVEKTFSVTSGVMFDGKLVVKSEETLKRLLYLLRLAAVRMRAKLLDYHNRKVIENYYVDISDFEQYNFQVILQGKDSVEKWIQEQKLKYVLYDTVQIGKRLPYFFSNKLVGPQIYLAQNTDTIEKAVKIAQTWHFSGYNIGDNPVVKEKELPSFTLYSYVHKGSIKKYNYTGLSSDVDIHILGYKIDEASYFTTLLPV
jgi:hypothetical protein